MKNGVLLIGAETVLGGNELAEKYAVERPAMRGGSRTELFLCLRERDVEDPLPLLHTFQQELQAQCRLARAGQTLDEVEPVGGQAAVEYLVQPSRRFSGAAEELSGQSFVSIGIGTRGFAHRERRIDLQSTASHGLRPCFVTFSGSLASAAEKVLRQQWHDSNDDAGRSRG